MHAPTAPAPPSPIEQQVARLRALQQAGRHDEALSSAQALLCDLPENRDLLLIAASSLRRQLRIPEALAMLDRLEPLQPRFSRMHEERGLCYVALKDAPRATESLLRAVNINPALPMSWRMLEGVYRLSGDQESASTAAAHAATLKGLPPEVVTATALFSDGELAQAEQITRAFLLKYGDDPEAMRLLAKIGMARDVLDDAETLLEAVLVLAPDYRAARLDYAQVLTQRQKYQKARKQVRKLLDAEPKNLDYRSLAGAIAAGLGEHEAAIALYREMLIDAPASPDIHLWLGHALKTLGRLPDAIEAYLAAAAARPDFGDAYWSLANLKTYRFDDATLERMRTEEGAPSTEPIDRYHLCFALGKALEDNGEIAASWSYYARGNALKRTESRYRPEIIETNTKQQIAVCTRAFFERREGWGAPSAEPIFIVGLPRSGSTLIEQILASHSQVEGTQELPDIQRIVIDLQGRAPDLDDPRYPGALADLTREDFVRLGERYLAETKAYRTGRPIYIDKMPNNFRHVGLIHLMLPNASIIDARRDPMSCSFSNLKQLFANGQEFTYSIEDIARYYRTYLELMRHWDEVLPGRVLRVQHEDVVADLEGSVRRLLDHCGLPFEPTCVVFHETERSVRTPSSEQVRQPIFRDGLDQWRKFEPWLEPLKAALGDALDRYRDEPAAALSSV
ncbi:MAG TPA: sulfotransferase [Caulobacteraceae bacterium]|nr:sulfotransferase [Caulobacteraceae bacterium]